MSGMEGVKLHRVQTTEDALELKRWLGERRPEDQLACDTETAGFHWWRPGLRLVQIGDTQTGWAVAWDEWPQLIREVAQEWRGEWVFHNAKFDLHWLDRGGVTIPRDRVVDTSVLLHLDDATQSHELKAVTAKYVDPHAGAGQHLLHDGMAEHKWTWATVPTDFPPYWQYGALDAVLTARLAQALAPTRRHYQDLSDLEHAVLGLLFEMEERGVRIDQSYCERAAEDLRRKSAELREWAAKEHSVANIASNDQLATALQAQGWVPTVLTAGGKPSVAKEVLEQVDHPLAAAAIHVKHLEKMASAYLETFTELADDSGLLHCSIKQLGAKTGRMSVVDPALQTLPRADPVVRDAFVPRDPSGQLLLADYDQIELRLLAHFAQEPAMIEAIRGGRDLHTYTAQLVFGLGDAEPAREQRQLAKNAGFAKLFGSGVETFAKTAGVSLTEAREFLAGYDRTYPGVRAFQRKVEQVARKRGADDHGRGWVRSPYGRVHRAPVDQAYKLVNYLIQGTAADVLKTKLVALDLAGLGEHLVLPIHDEVMIDLPSDVDGAEMEMEVVRVLEEHERFLVPLSVGSDRVTRWGDKYR